MHGVIERIKRQFPFWFSVYYNRESLHDIADSVRELRASPDLFFTLSDEIRKVREKASPEDSDKIKHAEFLTPHQKIDLLGLMSFSASGYVREAALEVLLGFETVDVLPYVILRLQDWVEPVRDRAQYLFPGFAAKAAAKDWEDCALLINRVGERAHGANARKLVCDHFRAQYSPQARAEWFQNTHKDMRRILWDIFTDQDLGKVATPSFITSESDPKLAGEIFRRLTKILPREEVVSVGIGHVSNRIRYAALQALYDLDGTELKSATETSLSDKSANVRDLARFIYLKRFGIHPKEHYRGFDIAPDNTDAKLGYVLGWLESSQSDPERFLQFYKQSPRGKIRGAALMAYARVGGYRDDIPELIIDALENGSHSRDVAAKLIKMGWASGISDQLWHLADKETELTRQLRLFNLAAHSDLQNALLPALRRVPNALPVVRKFLLEIVEKWSRRNRSPDMSEAAKIEGRALVDQLQIGRWEKDRIRFLFL